MPTHEQLREEWLENAKNSGESKASLQGIADWWLSKLTERDAELVKDLKEFREKFCGNEQEQDAFKFAIDTALEIIKNPR